MLALGTASTGAAISTLSGAEATNTALGGGSIASGGGIAFLLNAKGNSSFDKAEEAEREVEKIVSMAFILGIRK